MNRHGHHADAPLRCIDGPEGCAGPVKQRWPGYGQRTWSRCEQHANARIHREHAHRDEIPDGACIPTDFDPADAGERWAEA